MGIHFESICIFLNAIPTDITAMIARESVVKNVEDGSPLGGPGVEEAMKF
jgi:hypothetical protein